MTDIGSTAQQGQRIVVGVDGSESSRTALEWAAAQARLTGATLEVVMTWEYPANYGWVPVWPEGLDLGADAKKLLDDTIETVLGTKTGISIIATVAEGHPAPVLVERSRSASLIVVGSRGHGEFAGMLLGSVSEFLATHARCPVVIVHTAGRTSRA